MNSSLIDTSRITEPLERLPLDRVPAAGAAIASTVGDVTSTLADQIADHLSDIDLDDAVRRSRRAMAHVVPWVSAPATGRSRRRLLVAGGVVAVIVAVVVLRRRSSAASGRPGATTTDLPRSSDRSPSGRDEWTTASGNGSAPEPERDLESSTNS